jgi:serine/threonine-protein kinase
MPKESRLTQDCPPETAIVDLLDGRLRGPDAERVQQHVDGCETCRALVDELGDLATKEGAAGTEEQLARELLRSGPRGHASTDRVGRTLAGKYVLRRLLGKGGMGAVYEAEHCGTGRRVAVKVIHGHLLERSTGAVARFRREARAAGAVENPHVVEVLDSGEDDETGDLYLVMEHLRGEDLQHLVDRVGPLLPAVALRIAAQALAGLATAHEAGIVHRDIKPANLFLARRGAGEVTVKLCDFGIAKVKPDTLRVAHTSGLTESGSLLGSPLYMSPEQMTNSHGVDHRTDLWSLGSALYCALAGRGPFCQVENVLDLALAVRSPEGPPPVRTLAPWVPPEAAEVVRRALAVDPEERWPTAAAMLAAIQEMLPDGVALREEMLTGISPEQRASAGAPGGKETAVPPGDATGRRKRRPPRAAPSRWRLVLGGGGAALLAVAAVAGYAGMRRPAHAGVSPAQVETADPLTRPVEAKGASMTTSAPPVKTEPLHRVAVRVSPEDASVEVDGAPADVRGGAFDLEGALGSGHRVRVSKGRSEVSTEVFVTEKGAVPPWVELTLRPPPLPAPSVARASSVPAAAPAAPPSAAAPRRPPPRDGDPMRKPE